jgi:hypothetical protein
MRRICEICLKEKDYEEVVNNGGVCNDCKMKSEKFYKKKTPEELSQELIQTLKEIQTSLEELSFKIAIMVSGFRRYLEYQEEFKKFMREKKHE